MRSLDAIREEALQLGEEERGALADQLQESFLTPEELEIQAEWLKEVERRIEEYDAGNVKGIPYEDVMRELRAKYDPAHRASRRS